MCREKKVRGAAKHPQPWSLQTSSQLPARGASRRETGVFRGEMGFGSRQQLDLWGRRGAVAAARCPQQHFTAWWMCHAARVGRCSDPRQPPVPLSVCPSAPLPLHSHPTHMPSPCKPCPADLPSQGGPLPACSPVQGLYPHDARRKPQTWRPNPAPSPSLPCTGGRDALPEWDPRSLGKSRAPGAHAAFALWAAGSSFQAALPLAFRS